MRHLFVAMALVTVFASTTVLAGARQHFMAGQDYYSQGRYKKAIEEFEEAYRLDPKSLLLYNIAQAYEKLGDLSKAIEYIKKFIEKEPDTDDRPVLENKIKNLEMRIASTGISVTANEADAVIYVDDKEVGMTPAKGIIPLSTGAHKVRISKEGFKDFKMNIAVSAGLSVPVEAILEPGVAEPPPPPPIEEDTTADEGPQEDEGVEALDIVPWVVAGVGGAMAIVGLGVIGGLAKGAEPSNPDEDPTAQDDAHKKAVIADAIGWPGLAIAAGGAIWGIIRLTSKESSDSDGDSAAVIPFVDKDRAGVSASFTF